MGFKDKYCCYNGGERHNFEPRYDEVPRVGALKNFTYQTEKELRAALYYKKYICDVCTWCGKIIERLDKED